MLKRIGLGLVLIIGIAQAEELKVQKVSGRKAIVILPEGMAVKKGEVIPLKDKAGSEPPSSKAGYDCSSRRDLFTEIGFSYTSYTTSGSSTTTTSMSLRGLVGWNMSGGYELGPRFALGTGSSGSGSYNSAAVGGFFEYNFVKNEPGSFFVPALGGSALFGSISASGVSTSVTTYGPSLALKLFPRDNGIAFVPTLYYEVTNTSFEGINTNTNVLGLNLALRVYW